MEISLLYLKEERNMFPKIKALKIILYVIFFVFVSFLRGGDDSTSLLSIYPCGWMYHLANIIIFAISVLFCFFYSKSK